MSHLPGPHSVWEPAFTLPVSAIRLGTLEEAQGTPGFLSGMGMFCAYFHFLEFCQSKSLAM